MRSNDILRSESVLNGAPAPNAAHHPGPAPAGWINQSICLFDQSRLCFLNPNDNWRQGMSRCGPCRYNPHSSDPVN